MRTEPRAEQIRPLVRRVLRRLGARIIRPADVAETILIDAGRAMARSFRADGYLAMWLLDIGLVQFYNAEGDMLLAINLLESLSEQRMAA
jgi:hypothetical protein